MIERIRPGHRHGSTAPATAVPASRYGLSFSG